MRPVVFLATIFYVMYFGLLSYSLELQSEVDQAARQLIVRQGIPGVSIAIGREDEVVLAGAYGFANVEHRVPVKTDTLFRTASICKTFTAVAIMQLAEQGKLDLDEPVTSYFPELKKDDWTFTTRQLLAHISGIRHYKSRSESISTRHFSDTMSAMTVFVNDPLLHEPGSKYRYSSFGYNLLGAVIEQRSGLSYAQYVESSIAQVASMTHTRTDNHFVIIPNRSAGYTLARKTDKLPIGARRYLKEGELHNATMHDTSMKVPGGGMLSTPSDLVRFAMALLNDKLVSGETRKAMWTEQETIGGSKTGYGLGFRLYSSEQGRAVGHSGGQAGTSTLLMMRPESGTVVAVMTNLENASLHAATLQLLQAADAKPDDG